MWWLAALLAQVPVAPDGGVVLRVFQAPGEEPVLLSRAADGFWRDRHRRLRDAPAVGHELSDPTGRPVFAHDEWVLSLRATVRRPSPVPWLSWGMSSAEVAAFAKTAFHRQRWPLELAGARFFASPLFADAGWAALTALELEATSSPSVAWAALERHLGAPSFTGATWRAWQSGDSSVHAVEDAGRVKVLMVSRVFLLVDGR